MTVFENLAAALDWASRVDAARVSVLIAGPAGSWWTVGRFELPRGHRFTPRHVWTGAAETGRCSGFIPGGSGREDRYECRETLPR